MSNNALTLIQDTMPYGYRRLEDIEADMISTLSRKEDNYNKFNDIYNKSLKLTNLVPSSSIFIGECEAVNEVLVEEIAMNNVIEDVKDMDIDLMELSTSQLDVLLGDETTSSWDFYGYSCYFDTNSLALEFLRSSELSLTIRTDEALYEEFVYDYPSIELEDNDIEINHAQQIMFSNLFTDNDNLTIYKYGDIYIEKEVSNYESCKYLH